MVRRRKKVFSATSKKILTKMENVCYNTFGEVSRLGFWRVFWEELQGDKQCLSGAI
jgi:hypothetical protein